MADHAVGAVDSFLSDGGMKRLELEGQSVLVARVSGQYYAIGGNCTHYGGPLDEGALKGHTVMCPWHHACFDVRSGARIEPPALNPIAHYPVRIEAGQVIVTLPQDNAGEPGGKADPADGRVFVIVGGGPAGNAAAEELRQAGYQGKLIVLSAAPDVPVDRPNLSKDYLAGHADPAWIPLRGDTSWYAARDIDLRLNARVARVEPAAHRVVLEGGEALHYDRLLLATGGVARDLRALPGGDLEGIYTLRTLADSDRIIAAAAPERRAVIIGASFIGLEAAAALAGGRGVSVTVVAPESVPFEAVLGREIGEMLRREHEENGVAFRLGNGVARFLGAGGRVSGVVLSSGEELPADFVVVGIGVRLATDFLAGSGLKLDEKDRSVRVNRHLQTSDPDIYAAGDIARWEDGEGGSRRIEHWRVSEQHGMVAARNMLGGAEDINRHIPFFWTGQWSIILDYVGSALAWDEIIYRGGTPADKKFLAFYIRSGKVAAVAGCGHDRELDAVEFILRDGMPLTAQQLHDDRFDLIRYAIGR